MLLIFCMSLRVHSANVSVTKAKNSNLHVVGKDTATNPSPSTTVDSQTIHEDDTEKNNDNEDDANDNDDDDDDDDVNETIAASVNAAIDNELKTDIQAGNDVSSVSVWNVVRGIWDWLKNDIKESIFGEDSAVEGRTFGKIRRLQMALIPLIFKFGILTAMVAFLVLLGMKTIFLLKVLLLLNFLAIIGKFFTLKSGLFNHVEQQYSAPTWNYGGGWATASANEHHQHPSKEIHLHIHGAQPIQPAHAFTSYGNGGAQQQHWERRSDPYAAYNPALSETALLEHQLNTELNTELNFADPLSYLPTKYPPNHRQL